jgi:hypothetical protein
MDSQIDAMTMALEIVRVPLQKFEQSLDDIQRALLSARMVERANLREEPGDSQLAHADTQAKALQPIQELIALGAVTGARDSPALRPDVGPAVPNSKSPAGSHSDTFASRSFPHSVRMFSLLRVKAICIARAQSTST